MFISDNVATQIDGLAHITVGDDNHWYNGYQEAKWGGNWGVRKCDATTIPPIVTYDGSLRSGSRRDPSSVEIVRSTERPSAP